MLTVVAHQFRWHAFQFAAVEHIEEQGLQNVITVVAERNLGGTQLGSGAVKDTAAQTRTQGAGGFALGDLVLDDAVGVLLNDLVFHPQTFQIGWQDMLREARLFLIEVNGNQ